MISFFFLAFYTLLQLGSSLSSHWYVFLSSQYTVNLFSVKKFAHLVSFFRFFSSHSRVSVVVTHYLSSSEVWTVFINGQAAAAVAVVWTTGFDYTENIILLHFFSLLPIPHTLLPSFTLEEIIDSCLADSACAVALRCCFASGGYSPTNFCHFRH